MEGEKVMSSAQPENNVYRLLRIARDLKIKDVAEAVGVTPAYISAIEAGKREPALDKIPAYAKALQVDENTLFYFRNACNKPGKFESFLLAILRKITELDDGSCQ